MSMTNTNAWLTPSYSVCRRISWHFNGRNMANAFIKTLAVEQASIVGLGVTQHGGMGAGVWLHITECHSHMHRHSCIVHEHWHIHDEHHQHRHSDGARDQQAHSHVHVHESIEHSHPHYPDVHHRHEHSRTGAKTSHRLYERTSKT